MGPDGSHSHESKRLILTSELSIFAPIKRHTTDTMNLTRLALAPLVLSLACLPPAVADDTSSLSGVLSSLTASTKAAGDSQLNSLGSELKSKADALGKSLSGNPSAQSGLQSALQSLVSGKSADSLGGLQKLTAAKLTPEQTKLATDVFHVGSAYVVQKNFGSLEGAQGDVAQAVKSLRKGDAVSALPAIKNISQNAKLTAPQKQLITSIADKYAPGAGNVEKALEGIGGIPGFGK